MSRVRKRACPTGKLKSDALLVLHYASNDGCAAVLEHCKAVFLTIQTLPKTRSRPPFDEKQHTKTHESIQRREV